MVTMSEIKDTCTKEKIREGAQKNLFQGVAKVLIRRFNANYEVK